MYEVSEALATALEEQRLYIRVTCGETVLGSDQVSGVRYTASCGGEGTITIGAVTAAMVNLTVIGRRDWLDEIITVEVGAEVSGAVQYIPLGTFAIAECSKGEYTTELVGYDAAYYVMGAEYVPTVAGSDETPEDATVAEVLADVASQCGLTLATLPDRASTTVIRVSVFGRADLKGYTCREMAGIVAALVGCNVCVDRIGELTLRWFAYAGSSSLTDYYSGSLVLDKEFRLGFIACTVPVRSTVESITSRTIRVGHGTTGFSIQSPYMTQTILDEIWLYIGGWLFNPGSISLIGGLLFEPGDMIGIREPGGNSYRFPIQVLELTIDGGCQATLRMSAQGSAETAANVTGTVAERFRLVNSQIEELRGRLSS